MTLLNLNFLIYKMGMLIVLISGSMRVNEIMPEKFSAVALTVIICKCVCCKYDTLF